MSELVLVTEDNHIHTSNNDGGEHLCFVECPHCNLEVEVDPYYLKDAQEVDCSWCFKTFEVQGDRCHKCYGHAICEATKMCIMQEPDDYVAEEEEVV